MDNSLRLRRKRHGRPTEETCKQAIFHALQWLVDKITDANLRADFEAILKTDIPYTHGRKLF